jgi:amino acid transporter
MAAYLPETKISSLDFCRGVSLLRIIVLYCKIYSSTTGSATGRNEQTKRISSVTGRYFSHSDAKTILALAAAIEVIAFILLFLAFVMFRKKDMKLDPFIMFCVVFSLSLLIIIGYTVNVLGAIVRYRSLILPLLIVPMACLTDWNRAFELFFGNIKNKNNIRKMGENAAKNNLPQG